MASLIKSNGQRCAHVPSWRSSCSLSLSLCSLSVALALNIGIFFCFYTICFRSSFCWHTQKCTIFVAFAFAAAVAVVFVVCLIGGPVWFLRLRRRLHQCACAYAYAYACVCLCKIVYVCRPVHIALESPFSPSAYAAAAVVNCVVNANYLLFYSRSAVSVAVFPKKKKTRKSK